MEPDRVRDDDLVPVGECVPERVTLGERVGVTEGEAPFDSVAVCDAVRLRDFEEVALFVGETDGVRLLLDVRLEVILTV